MRRRSERPNWFDRLMVPGYIVMDWGMLRVLRKRAETAHRPALAA